MVKLECTDPGRANLRVYMGHVPTTASDEVFEYENPTKAGESRNTTLATSVYTAKGVSAMLKWLYQHGPLCAGIICVNLPESTQLHAEAVEGNARAMRYA